MSRFRRCNPFAVIVRVTRALKKKRLGLFQITARTPRALVFFPRSS